MRKFRFMFIFAIILLILTACFDGSTGPSNEGFDFSEDEAADDSSEDEMDFSDEAGSENDSEQGFDFTEDDNPESSSESGFDFTEDEESEEPSDSGFDFTNDDEGEDPGPSSDDEPTDNSNNPGQILPPEGTSTWVITYGNGTINCPNISQSIDESPPETVTITLGVDGNIIVVKGMGEAPEIFLFLLDSGSGGSRFVGYHEVPGEVSEIKYEMFFTNTAGQMAADFGWGNISNETQGCQVNREFSGQRQN